MSNIIPFKDFIHHYSQNSSLMMWFLGAGTSRSAGMPTATDLIWDLKRQYYCLQENIDIDSQDINNKAVKDRIQLYMESKGFPEMWSAEEYSFYFELLFTDDYERQQRYLNQALATEKISLNVGHRILAGMMGAGITNIVFTTNFDEVIETAYSSIVGKNLNTFHIEGAYAALEALNSENFPIYTKLHGDFRYQSIKNLNDDLLSNDEKLQECFMATATRYGLVISGYSGRDQNVMSMIRSAIDQNNSFPRGLFWTVFNSDDVADTIIETIEYANAKGIDSAIVETGTFDETISRVWKQIPNKDNELAKKVNLGSAEDVSITLPESGTGFPLVRTNALPILSFPSTCGLAIHQDALTFSDIKECLISSKPEATVCYTDKILFWGDQGEITRTFGDSKIKEIATYEFSSPETEIEESTHLRAQFERALVGAIAKDKPVHVQRRRNSYHIFVNHRNANDNIFDELKQVHSFKGRPGFISGQVKEMPNTFWAEAISLQLDFKNGQAWLLLEPDIWISPSENRKNTKDFLRKKKLYRWNAKANSLLDAWLNILFGGYGKKSVEVALYENSQYPFRCEICTRTAFSRASGSQ